MRGCLQKPHRTAAESLLLKLQESVTSDSLSMVTASPARHLWYFRSCFGLQNKLLLAAVAVMCVCISELETYEFELNKYESLPLGDQNDASSSG